MKITLSDSEVREALAKALADKTCNILGRFDPENQRMRDIEEEYTSMILVIYGISALAVVVHYLGDYL